MDSPIESLADRLMRPLTVGDSVLSSRLVLASLSDLGNAAFRQLIDEFGGCGLFFGEMWLARAVIDENRHHSRFFCWRDEEASQLVPQLLGNDPDSMAAAARRLESEGFFGVDLNFSCSAKKICRQNLGAALLADADQMLRITEAVRRAVSLPLFVKCRIGPNHSSSDAAGLAERLAAAGVDALTFHPRQAPDRRSRPAKQTYIRDVKSAVSIPVFGNGDVFTEMQCCAMLDQTGCDGVALGRLALAKPWIFAQWTSGYRPESGIYAQTMRRLLTLLVKHYTARDALRRMKKFAFYYSAGFRYGHTLHRRISGAKNLAEVGAVVDDFFHLPPEINTHPNLNFFT